MAAGPRAQRTSGQQQILTSGVAGVADRSYDGAGYSVAWSSHRRRRGVAAWSVFGAAGPLGVLEFLLPGFWNQTASCFRCCDFWCCRSCWCGRTNGTSCLMVPKVLLLVFVEPKLVSRILGYARMLVSFLQPQQAGSFCWLMWNYCLILEAEVVSVIRLMYLV
ncbi:unnamed protein product [Urochloa humidicola]